MITKQEAKKRLQYLRQEINHERISYAEFIDPDDVQLLEWAGVPEFATSQENDE